MLRCPGPPGVERTIALGRRSIVAVLLITLCAAVVVASAFRPDPFRPDRVSTEPSARSGALLSGNGKTHRRRTPSSRSRARLDPEIDALAASLGKRYRVSIDATRSLVATAYREGLRIGLDPLLIIAVIAVESRFNPLAESDMGAQGLMQVIPRFHKEHLEGAGTDSVLDPHANIRLGARVLKDYIRSGGTEVAGLQRYNGSTGDGSNAYAAKVLGEKQRLQQAVQRLRNRA